MLQTDDREVPSMLTTTLAADAAGCERGDVHEAAPVLATLLRCTRVCVHDRLLHHSVLSKNSICNMPPRSQDLTAAGGACVGEPLFWHDTPWLVRNERHSRHTDIFVEDTLWQELDANFPDQPNAQQVGE